MLQDHKHYIQHIYFWQQQMHHVYFHFHTDSNRNVL